MMEETVAVVCPNPKCLLQVKEHILLPVYSTSPATQFEACPYCFVALKQEQPEPETEHEEAQPQVTELEDMEDYTEEAEDYIEDEEETETAEPSTVFEKIKTSSPAFFKRFKSLIQNAAESQKAHEPEIEEENEYENEETLTDDEEPEYEAYEPEEETEDILEEDIYEPEKEPFEEDTYEPEEPQAPEIQTTKTDAPKSECCPKSFGYLCNRPKDAPIPAECMLCPKIVDCMLKRE